MEEDDIARAHLNNDASLCLSFVIWILNRGAHSALNSPFLGSLRSGVSPAGWSEVKPKPEQNDPSLQHLCKYFVRDTSNKCHHFSYWFFIWISYFTPRISPSPTEHHQKCHKWKLFCFIFGPRQTCLLVLVRMQSTSNYFHTAPHINFLTFSTCYWPGTSF